MGADTSVHWRTDRAEGASRPVWHSRRGGICADEKEKEKKKRKKEDQERQKERYNNCLSSFLMPLCFYRLYRYAQGRLQPGRYHDNSSTDISSTTLRLQTFRLQTFRLL